MVQERSRNRLVRQSRLHLRTRRISQQPLVYRNQCKDPKAEPTGLFHQSSFNCLSLRTPGETRTPIVQLCAIRLEVGANTGATPAGFCMPASLGGFLSGEFSREPDNCIYYLRALYSFSNADLAPRSHDGEQNTSPLTIHRWVVIFVLHFVQFTLIRLFRPGGELVTQRVFPVTSLLRLNR